MRLGLYGGTFDPVHNAHLRVAEMAFREFQLDKVLFIPNKLPPHKSDGAQASFADRLAMVDIACASYPDFEACGIENHEGKSYTIETLSRLRGIYGNDARLFFIIGADAFSEVRSWYQVNEVFRMTEFIVAARPGYTYEIPPGCRVHALPPARMDESSTAIRSEFAAGRNPDGLPSTVAEYIRKRGLYRVVGQTVKS